MICHGSASRSLQRRAWVLNSPRGSRISTQRRGTAANPVLYQTAVPETISTARSLLPYQWRSVIDAHSVSGFFATTERLGSRSPLRRALPICWGRPRGGRRRGGGSGAEQAL